MSSRNKTPISPYLHPLPLPDVLHTTEPMLPAPDRVDGGRCFCCGADMKHRFLLPESLPLSRLAEAAEDTLIRLERTKDTLRRVTSRQPPEEGEEQKKYEKALKAADTALQHASLAARRLALRHIPAAILTDTGTVTAEEMNVLSELTPPFHLCYICHAWHALNGFAAAQGVMVWLPDLHPRSIVSLNRKALQAVFSASPATVREGRKVLTELVRHRLPLEARFGGWRPVDFADALHRFPPSMRNELREKMGGVALILTADSVPEPEYLVELEKAEHRILSDRSISDVVVV